MKGLWIVGAALQILFRLTTESAPHPDSDGQQTIDHKKSGLKGTTISRVVGGVPGGQTTETRTSVEFAIAPIEGGAISHVCDQRSRRAIPGHSPTRHLLDRREVQGDESD